MHSSAALRVLSGRSVRRNGSVCSRDQTIGSFDSTMVPNCRRRLTDAAVTLLAGVHVEGRAIDPVIVRQQPGKEFRLVVLIAAQPVPLHFLQGDDVGAGNDLAARARS